MLYPSSLIFIYQQNSTTFFPFSKETRLKILKLSLLDWVGKFSRWLI